ncbi:jg12755 [Pararge aegeria aegeria]|uniref:Jg12755 protein n=1 Tax=Pararge aegeria aegeria TaxID=348720 RepID=A0A8S4S7B9_9NEOP|nr:jg12755 [Pararge aegeria aegeria]
MESENRTLARHKHDEENWRRRCGCLRTSDKLKQIIDCFPPPPPPTPEYPKGTSALGNTCISAFCTNVHHCSTLQPPAHNKVVKLIKETHEELEPDKTLKKVSNQNVFTEDEIPDFLRNPDVGFIYGHGGVWIHRPIGPPIPTSAEAEVRVSQETPLETSDRYFPGAQNPLFGGASSSLRPDPPVTLSKPIRLPATYIPNPHNVHVQPKK